MNKFKIITIIFLITFSSTQNIFATWCRGKQLPEQKDFWVFETGLKYEFASRNVRNGKGSALGSLEVGYMRNFSKNLSRGLSLYLSGDDDGSVFALKYRQRHWLSKDLSLEFSPGIILSATDNYINVKIPGYLASITYNLQDLFAFELQYQLLRYTSNRYLNYMTDTGTQTQSVLYGGIRFGSYAALASIGVSVVLITVALILFPPSDTYF